MRGKMMTKSMVIAISISALLISSILFYYTLGMPNSSAKLDNFSARKEDLYLRQQMIEQTLYNLNHTIQIEAEKQKILTDKLIELSAKADLPPPMINTTKIVQEPPVIVKVPKPVQPPVTRAS